MHGKTTIKNKYMALYFLHNHEISIAFSSSSTPSPSPPPPPPPPPEGRLPELKDVSLQALVTVVAQFVVFLIITQCRIIRGTGLA
jgi:hypothetical protein